MTLTRRLASVASLASPLSGVLIDIGSDHGYFPAYMAEKYPDAVIFAADISPYSLDKIKSLKYALGGLVTNLFPVLSDGLSFVRLPGYAEKIGNRPLTVTLTGIGGITAADIIESALLADHALLKDAKLILQPAGRTERLREYLTTRGFLITAEELVRDSGEAADKLQESGRLYTNICAVYTGVPAVPPYSETELLVGRHILSAPPCAETARWLAVIIKRLCSAKTGLEHKYGENIPPDAVTDFGTYSDILRTLAEVRQKAAVAGVIAKR